MQKPGRCFVLILLVLFCCSALSYADPAISDGARFEKNLGQTDKSVDFLLRGSGYELFLVPGEAVLAIGGGTKGRASAVPPAILRMKFVGADSRHQGNGLDKTPEHLNYYLGNDRSRWMREVPVFSKVKYTAVYPGIDLLYYSRQKQLEYDFVVAPGADPRRIAMDIGGAGDLKVDASGDLVLSTARGDVVQKRPIVFQEIGGRRAEVDAAYRLDHNRVRFQIGKYDTRYPLVIDPALIYSTYIAGTAFDAVYGTAVDSQGNAYVTGYTDSYDFPGNTTLGGSTNHVFVMKVDTAGARIWSTVIGGSGDDVGNGITVGQDGNIYITGQAGSSDFPNTFSQNNWNSNGGMNAFVAKIGPGKGDVIFSTPYGGDGDENGVGVAADGTGVVISGTYTRNGFRTNDLPTTPDALQGTFQGGSTDAFVAKFSLDGTKLKYATYLGGTGDDTGNRCAVDASGIYVTGFTGSAGFPTANAFQGSLRGGQNAFVTKLILGQSKTTLGYSTYLGGSGRDSGQGIKVLNGYAYVSGQATSNDFPVKGAYQKKEAGGYDVFVTKLNPAGQIVYSTYLGGSMDDFTWDIAVDASGAAYVAGQTTSPDFPVINSLRDVSLAVNGDAFVTKLAPSGGTILGSTTIGGSAGATGWSLEVDRSSGAYVGGETSSPDLTGTNGGRMTYSDGFLTKIGFPNSSITSNFNGTAIPAGRTIWFSSTLFLGNVPGGGATIRVRYGTIYFQANGVTYSVPVPDAQIRFDPTQGCVSSTFDGVQWATTSNPAYQYKRTLIAAVPFTVPAVAFPGSINPITWSAYFSTDTPGVQVKWSWAAAVYTQMGTDYNTLGVKSADSNACSVSNSDQAGTPEQYTQFVTGGARGGGGNNYTGSLTQTVTLSPDMQ